jgi:hypothetical protein
MKLTSILYQEHPHLFGLSRKAPQAMPSGLTNLDITESDVDIFLDELEGLNLKVVEASRDTQAGNLWELMHGVRRNAVHMLESDMLTAMLTLYGTSRQRFAGTIGGTGSTGLVQAHAGQELGMRLVPKPGTGANLVIKRIGLLLDSDARVEVSISGVTGSFEVVASADTPSFVVLPTPVSISLDQVDAVTVSYLAGSFSARNNIISCGCTTQDGIMLGYFSTSGATPANGLMLDAEIFCDSRNVITRNFDASAEIEATLGYAARFKAGELLVEGIVASGAINRYTMLDREHLWGKRNHFRKEYQDRITWLVGSDGVDISLSACYPCKVKENDALPLGHILI